MKLKAFRRQPTADTRAWKSPKIKSVVRENSGIVYDYPFSDFKLQRRPNTKKEICNRVIIVFIKAGSGLYSTDSRNNNGTRESPTGLSGSKCASSDHYLDKL